MLIHAIITLIRLFSNQVWVNTGGHAASMSLYTYIQQYTGSGETTHNEILRHVYFFIPQGEIVAFFTIFMIFMVVRIIIAVIGSINNHI